MDEQLLFTRLLSFCYILGHCDIATQLSFTETACQWYTHVMLKAGQAGFVCSGT